MLSSKSIGTIFSVNSKFKNKRCVSMCMQWIPDQVFVSGRTQNLYLSFTKMNPSLAKNA